jgi:hypothetical protein
MEVLSILITAKRRVWVEPSSNEQYYSTTKFRHEYGGKYQQTPAHLKLSNPVTVNKINSV